MKKILFILTCFFFFLIPNIVFASDYEIIGYDIDINVGKNNVLEIKENITVDFSTNKHGIYRYIPRKNYVSREDGSTNVVGAKIKKIDLNKEFEEYNDGNNKVIQIGSASQYVTGIQNYEISYLYDLGYDKNKGFDELYFNIIGTGWDTTLSNVTFTIHMPLEFDTDKFGISLGEYGTSGASFSDVDIDYEGNTIVGRVYRTLNPSEALTARIELEDGYFEREVFSALDFIIMSIPVVCAVVGIYLTSLMFKIRKHFENSLKSSVKHFGNS